MKSDQLLNQLADDLQPVRVQSVARVLGGVLGVGSLICLAAFFVDAGIREGVVESLSRAPLLVVTFIASLILGGTLLATASFTAIPGRKLPFGMKGVLAAAALVFVGGMLYGAVEEGAWLLSTRCARDVALVALPATVLAFLQLRKLAPVHPVRTGVLAALGWGVIAGALFLLACSDESPFHVLFCHYVLPASVFAGAAALAGRRFLRW